MVLGVSPDLVKSHHKFCQRHDLKLTLTSDPEHKIMGKYGVWQRKKLCGGEYCSLVRSTFIINPEETIAHHWQNVKVPGRAEEVKKQLSAPHTN